MKERPILFSAPMVRAILAGTKTQTRRVVKPYRNDPTLVVEDFGTSHPWPYRETFDHSGVADSRWPLECPYGRSGGPWDPTGFGFAMMRCADTLWVRETHMDLGACYLYRADDNAEQERALVAPGQPWRPAIHMPRAASRITLEVTGVRVERLQDIREADAQAEGVERVVVGEGWRRYNPSDAVEAAGLVPCETARASFRSLWESINGPGSWDANPWVWVVEFRRV